MNKNKKKPNIQSGVPKVNYDRAKRGMGSMQETRIRLGLTRQAMSDRYGVPVSRIAHTEYKCSWNEWNGNPANFQFTPANNTVLAALRKAETEIPQTYPALSSREQESVDTAAGLMVDPDKWHLTQLQQQLPAGSKIEITLPTGLRLTVTPLRDK